MISLLFAKIVCFAYDMLGSRGGVIFCSAWERVRLTRHRMSRVFRMFFVSSLARVQ